MTVGMCFSLQTCNSVLNMLIMWLARLMAVPTTDILLYAEVSPLYSALWECILLFTNMLVMRLVLGWSYLPSAIFLCPELQSSHYNAL